MAVDRLQLRASGLRVAGAIRVDEIPVVPLGGGECSVEVDSGVLRGNAGLQEETLHTGGAEDHDPSPGDVASVATRVNHVSGHMNSLAGGQPRFLSIDSHLEIAFENMDRLRYAAMKMRGQR